MVGVLTHKIILVIVVGVGMLVHRGRFASKGAVIAHKANSFVRENVLMLRFTPSIVVRAERHVRMVNSVLRANVQLLARPRHLMFVMVDVFRYKHILNIAESADMFAKNRRAVLLVYAVLRRRRVVLGGLVLVRYFVSMEYVFLLSVMQRIRVRLGKNVSRAAVSKKH